MSVSPDPTIAKVVRTRNFGAPLEVTHVVEAGLNPVGLKSVLRRLSVYETQ